MTQGIVSDTKRRRGRARKSLQPAHAALDETPESPEPSPPDSVPAGRHKRAAAAKPLPADPPSPDGDEVEEDEEDDFRPTRHRAGAGSKNVAEQDTEDADYRPERSGPPHIQAALGPGSTRKRRKSTTPVTADDRSETARELLSEEQKRANHIESEKKRRQNIRAGFERLVEMVPDLKADTAGRGATIKNEALILQKCASRWR